jgi:hypothetical protein
MSNNHTEIEERRWASADELRANSKHRLLQTFEVIDDRMADLLRQKSDTQRLRSVDAFWNSARAILKAAIRTKHPEWSLDQVHVEIARRISNGAIDHVHA